MLIADLLFTLRANRAFMDRIMTSTLLGVLLLAASALASAQSESQVHLLPQPREARFAGEVSIAAGIRVEVPGGDPEDKFAASDLREAAVGLKDDSGSYPVMLLRAGS